MKKFWEWMVERGYGCYEGSAFGLVVKNKKTGGSSFIPIVSRQMLIGYMIEYINSMGHLYQLCSCGKSIEDLYDCLERVINKLEG